ncbi:transketolase [Actinomycetaceae bacterium TAE3-ERU4]|nr:transketolase [Actinomycetaceae bacterium TAE3-ERU4]
MGFDWSEQDKRAVDMLKAQAADAVENAGNGHPGTPISLAPVAYLLYRDHLRYDVDNPRWVGRDRFVLSIGHASMIQYSQLYLHGLGLELEDIKQFRHLGSKTPGHPEVFHTDYVEITTGPLGSGISSAVGMAMSARRTRALLDPDNPTTDSSVFDYNVYALMGDGDMQEGMTHEACSLAGTQKLGNLIAIYDDNQISIEGNTSITFTEDVEARFRAYGWHTQFVDFTADKNGYHEDMFALNEAIEKAKQVTDKPSLIRVRTIIGWPSPNKQNTGGIHGAKLGSEELAGLKEALGLDPQVMFYEDRELVENIRRASAKRSHSIKSAWDKEYAIWEKNNPESVALLKRLLAKELPSGWEDVIPHFGTDSIATRAASGQVINALSKVLPELWGGSADLAGSNNTLMKSESSFFPAELSSKEFQGSTKGRNLHFGVREHGMGALMNGIALSDLFLPYGGTFMVFSDYMRGAIRLAALMKLPVTYVFTHDSIGVGEDGPTHQPIEHLASLRAIPNLAVVRPADANETAQAWKTLIEKRVPAVLALTRQNISCPDRQVENLASASELSKGAYVLRDLGKVEIILIATGSEVELALEAQTRLYAEGIGSRVVSMPCMEWFNEQSESYRNSVLPTDGTPRLAIEAGSPQPWFRYVADEEAILGISTFGIPGSAKQIYEHFGLTAENIVAKANKLLSR